MTSELTGPQQAAAFHGLATNAAFPLHERLQLALQALDLYEVEVERLGGQVAESVAADRARVVAAKRRLFARIIASAHLLDQPFTDAPEQSPWSLIKADMNALNAALKAEGGEPNA